MSKVTRPLKDIGSVSTRTQRNGLARSTQRLVASQGKPRADQTYPKYALPVHTNYGHDVQILDHQRPIGGGIIDSQAKDIVPGDLKATLEAHRTANRERHFRKFALDAKEPHGHGAQASSEHPPAQKARPSGLVGTSSKANSASSIEALQRNGPRNRYTYLNERMEKFTKLMLLKPIEANLREAIAVELMTHLRGAVPGVEYRIFGSQKTNLAHPLSDIDIGFHLPSLVKEDGQRGPSESLSRRQNQKLVLRTIDNIQEAVRLMNDLEPKYVNVTVIKARFPLLQLQHASSGQDIQIVFQRSQSWDQMLCSNYLAEFPLLKPLYLFLKATIAARTSLSTQAGGPGSYPLFMMIVAWFKLHPWAIRKDLPQLLLGFLDFYGHFETRKSGISISPIEMFAKIGQGNLYRSKDEKNRIKEDPIHEARSRIDRISKAQPWLLCLQDPANPSNDLGKHMQNIRELQALFRDLYRLSTAWLNDSSSNIAEKDLVSCFLLNFPDRLRVQRVTLWEALESNWGMRLLEQHENGSFSTNTTIV